MADKVPLPLIPLFMDQSCRDEIAVIMHAYAADQSAADNAVLRAELEQAMKERARALSIGDDMEQEAERLRERVKVLEQLITDATYTLSKARIWNGMGWTYNPLHPIHYTPMRERLSNEADNIYAALGDKTP